MPKVEKIIAQKADYGQSEPLPILIGLSGKRDLHGRTVEIGTTLLRAFDRLDHSFPHAPKVLVTGLAEGADMLASQLALNRPSWRVFGLLPMRERDYAVTISSDAARNTLKELLGHPRVRHRELEPLALPSPASRAGEISGCSDTSLHYEQLGLWLAEHAAILFAVLPADEAAAKPGGTARVVQHRLQGAPDAIGRAVIDLSAELAHRPVLDPPDPRPIWRIDLTAPPVNGALPSAIIDPGHELTGLIPHKPMDLRKLFPLAADIDEYNCLAGVPPIAEWPATAPEATALLSTYRTTLSAI